MYRTSSQNVSRADDASNTASPDVSSSPSSFPTTKWNHDDGTTDVAARAQDPISRLVCSGSTKEACKEMEAVSSFENVQTSSSNQGISFLKSLSSRPFFPRRKSACQSAGTVSLETVDTEGITEWSMQTFSQLMASSQRESLRWLTSSTITEDGLDEGIFETIMAAHSPISSMTSASQAGLEKCSLCSRWLLSSSPWSAQRMVINNNDLPVVGVLACGHVYHADCLEKAVPEALEHDPPCPECNGSKISNTKLQPNAIKGTRELLKMKASRIGSHVWRRSTSLKFKGKLHSTPSCSAAEKRLFPWSVLKNSWFLHSKSHRDSSVQMLGSSKIFNSPAQVSSENQV